MLEHINANAVVVGLDMGGTNIRAMIADLSGHVLAYVKNGSSLRPKDQRDPEPLRSLVREALRRAGRAPEDAMFLAAGVAGYDDADDLRWVERLTGGIGLNCPSRHVNDAVIAHRGAFAGSPGILIAAGTGAILLGHTERGDWLRNYDFGHYAAAAARFISYEAVYEALAGGTGAGDEALLRDMLSHFGAGSTLELAESGSRGFGLDPARRDRLFGAFAPVVTREAEAGAPLAERVCAEALRQIGVGASLLAAFFAGPDIRISQTGSVADSEYFRSGIQELQCTQPFRRFLWSPPRLSPAAGAVLVAYEGLGLPAGEDLLRTLESTPGARLS
ncbi:BadF/BadG/BcrA/BcrD ATPase family protein [Saccharibacillus sp. CPCC 101409]|uniref:BadF/BadG/BcrA/BcrD ATPase family protein n=1 Tax=Saccharibacillus sp. CPCC 101409 TaxID=3058041 RepID=UPI00267158A5|nr:BadF/BadG/BcrA/BcrD ATPase family protein [Saccharibacillus sp. CPCC 101409]MDO3411082.1 BadF/BadG/BcrA/BcrD ATPase family protein [Saccharibacillus sp. CPCC 101409]